MTIDEAIRRLEVLSEKSHLHGDTVLTISMIGMDDVEVERIELAQDDDRPADGALIEICGTPARVDGGLVDAGSYELIDEDGSLFWQAVNDPDAGDEDSHVLSLRACDWPVGTVISARVPEGT